MREWLKREWFMGQLATYASYHRDHRNQATHFIGVPTIIWAIQIALAAISPTLALFATLLLILFYAGADWRLACVTAAIYLPLAWIAGRVWVWIPDMGWAIAAACFLGGWAIQFLGHVFEGKKPAFLDNAVQLLFAPAFLSAEMLFKAGLAGDLKARFSQS